MELFISGCGGGIPDDRISDFNNNGAFAARTHQQVISRIFVNTGIRHVKAVFCAHNDRCD